MKAVSFGEVQRWVMRQRAVPKFGLRLGDDIVGFGQLLNVIRAMHQWIMIKLLVPDLHHMQDDLDVLGIIFSQLLLSASRVRAKAADDTSFTFGRFIFPQSESLKLFHQVQQLQPLDPQKKNGSHHNAYSLKQVYRC